MTPQQLRRWRLARDWTQAEAAAWYGCSVDAWQSYEQGRRPIPRPLVRRIEELED